MFSIRSLAALAVIVSLTAAAWAEAPSTVTSEWLTSLLADTSAEAETATEAETADAGDGLPIPFHTIGGYGGAAFTPIAYLVNPGPAGTVVGKPAASATFVRLGSKDLQSVAVTQTFFRRIELGYAANRLGLGSLDNDIRKLAGVDINRSEVYLHHFNIRGLLIEENSFDLPLPALTAGVHFKYNDTIEKIYDRLGGILSGLGYEKSNGVDYTLTASKMFPELAFGRPIVITGGGRFSNAAQMGYLGFGDEYKLTFEGNVAYLPTDWLVLVYEYRQKENPYHKLDKIIGDEDGWHAVSAHWLVNEHMSVTGAWICAGNIANSSADGGWALQVKWEF